MIFRPMFPLLESSQVSSVTVNMSSSSDIASQIQSTTHPVDLDALQSEVRNHLDGDFGDLDVLLGRHAGPSSRPSSSRGPQKRKRTLREEIGYWEQQETAAAKEV